MNESTTITIDNIAKLIKGIAEGEYQRGYVAGLEEKRLTEKHWGKNKEDKTELNNIIKNAHGSIENRINAAYNLGRREGYKEQEPCDVFDEYGNYKYPSDVELTEPNTATSMPCEDAISRQAAIDAMYALCNTDETLKENPWRDNPHIDAITDAIEDLPPVNPQPCPDAINRQAVNEIINDIRDCISVEGYCAILERLKKLPSVNPLSKDYNTIYYTPQPKTGRWIFDKTLDEHYYCSECKSMGVDYWDFCPYCGAKMIEPQESEDKE